MENVFSLTYIHQLKQKVYFFAVCNFILFLMCFLSNVEQIFLNWRYFLETSITMNDKYISMHFQLTETVLTRYVLFPQVSKIQYVP